MKIPKKVKASNESAHYMHNLIGKNEFVLSYNFTEFLDIHVHQKIHNIPNCYILILKTKCLKIVHKYILSKVPYIACIFQNKGRNF